MQMLYIRQSLARGRYLGDLVTLAVKIAACLIHVWIAFRFSEDLAREITFRSTVKYGDIVFFLIPSEMHWMVELSVTIVVVPLAAYLAWYVFWGKTSRQSGTLIN